MKDIFTLIFSLTTILTFAQLEGNLKGELVPDFSFENKPGQEVQISSLRGKNIMIVFFATWCGPCRKELPYIEEQVWEKLGNRSDFELLIFGREHCWNDLNKFRKSNGFSMPFYPDPNRKVFSQFADASIPRSYIVNKNGKIVCSTLGFSENSFKEVLTTLNDLMK